MSEKKASSLVDGAARIRETAKWFAVSLAGIAAILVAGSQFSNIGSLEVFSVRMVVAVVGALLAAVAAVLVLQSTSSAMATPAVSLDDLAKTTPPSGTKTVREDPTLLQGHESVAALLKDYKNSLIAREKALKDHYAKPGDKNLETLALYADARSQHMNGISQELLGVASYMTVVDAWRRARIKLVIAGILGGVGISLFAWASNPPEAAVASSASASVLTSPQDATVNLSQAGIDALSEALGEGCLTEGTLDARLLGGTDAGADVLVEPSETCNEVRFLLTPEWGSVSAHNE